MAGIWDRLQAADDGLAGHQVNNGLVLYWSGIATKAQVVTYLNGFVETSLTAAEQTDLSDIADVLDAKKQAVADSPSTAQALIALDALLDYRNGLHALFMVARSDPSGLLTETAFRNRLEI